MGMPAIAEDRATRDRLIEAAGQLFADHGFRKVTVREICRVARANVAAVNYHFGDKLGLYREVLETAISVQEATTAAARAAGEGLAADQKLRAFVQTFVSRVVEHRPTWVRGLMFREMSDPTPALDVIVERGIRPRFDYLCAIVAELLDCPVSDERVLPCAGSVQSQLMMAVPNPIAARLRPGAAPGAADVAQLVEHITRFSLAGIASIGE
jgi:TetR/AcrR family transcriptional regulator, regulator of cefoperazone and chloramphenicol sensitivity